MLLEHRPRELYSKIQAAEAAIYERLQAMAHDSSTQGEREVIADAVSTLRILQREKLSFPDEIDFEHMGTRTSGVEPVKRCSARWTVLVVDDNPAIRQAISRAFLANGFGVCATTDNGADAIGLVERLKPDVIILDLSMPVMDGWQTAPRLRKVAPDTPIILFTLYGDEFPIEYAKAIGIDLVLSKTDSIFSVVSKARELIENRGGPAPRQRGHNLK